MTSRDGFWPRKGTKRQDRKLQIANCKENIVLLLRSAICNLRSPVRRSRATLRRTIACLLLAAGLAGCSSDVDATYGRSRGASINGTNALADLLRARGHEVRVARQYNETLGDWARVVVRFAPQPGPIARDEATWLGGWLAGGPGRAVIYVPRDADTRAEFWDRMLAALDPQAPASDRVRIERRRDDGRKWPDELPEPAKAAASPDDWFGTEPDDRNRPKQVATCAKLGGPWAEGVDAAAAALPRRESIRAENGETTLLAGDGRKLAIEWPYANDSGEPGRVLVVANASFLLNAALLNRARRPLAARVVDWVGDAPAHVAFVEGAYPLFDPDAAQASPFHLLTVEPFGWVAAQLGAFGAILALSLAATLGRPRPEPVDVAGRPSLHPVALGAILARTRQADLARDLLDAYRRWRQPAAGPHPVPTRTPSPRRVPHA